MKEGVEWLLCHRVHGGKTAVWLIEHVLLGRHWGGGGDSCERACLCEWGPPLHDPPPARLGLQPPLLPRTCSVMSGVLSRKALISLALYHTISSRMLRGALSSGMPLTLRSKGPHLQEGMWGWYVCVCVWKGMSCTWRGAGHGPTKRAGNAVRWNGGSVTHRWVAGAGAVAVPQLSPRLLIAMALSTKKRAWTFGMHAHAAHGPMSACHSTLTAGSQGHEVAACGC